MRRPRGVVHPHRPKDLHLPPLPALGLSRAAGAVAAVGLLTAALGAAVPGAAAAQDPDGPAFHPPLASPLEPAFRLAPVRVDRGDTERWVGLLDFGERFTATVRSPDREDGLRLDLAVSGGAFTRFDLETSSNEFVEAHFRGAVQGLARRGRLAARLELHHVSSHLGDEFLVRTGRQPISTSREGVELLMQADPVSELRVYAGGGVLLRSTEDLEPLSARGGLEWWTGGGGEGPAPYVAADVHAWEEVGWDPAVAAEVGLATGGGRYRLALTAGAGPSRAEQFVREDETFWGVVFSADP